MRETVRLRLGLAEGELAAFCQRWRIVELSLFGSALREDFQLDSDIDLLATFAPEAGWSLIDHVAMEQELAALLGRKADVLTRRSVEASRNWLLRKNILASAEVIYESR